MEPQIRYARTSDGVDIAYAVVGNGPPLVVVRPVLRPALDDELLATSDAPWLTLASARSVVVWDPRGFGLSSAAAPEYTLQSSLFDVEAVANALELRRFDLLAHVSQCHTAVAFAARQPERVGRLALWNPTPPGSSARTGTFADLPEIGSTHFREYVQLAALRLIGWERAPAAQRFVDNILAQFSYETLERVMDQIEGLDATQEAGAVVAPALVIIDRSAQSFVAQAEVERYRRRLAALLPNAQLAVLKRGAARPYPEVVAEFLAAGESESVIAPHGTAVILFADIADSTALTERLGDAAFREKARGLDEALRKAISANGGTAIEGKLLGDGVLATFGAAREAIACAQAIHAAGSHAGLPLHIGIHAGDVIRESNPDGRSNVYGGAVNIASRVAGEAAAGETLVSGTVRDLARTSAGVSFEDRGERELKGVGEPVRVFAVGEQA